MKKTTTGLGQRLIEAIKAKGYPDPDAKYGIRVTDFALDHRYAPQAVFKWISDTVVPDYATMLRLARDLGTTPGWLHYGDAPPPAEAPRKRRRLTPISGGSHGDQTPPGGEEPDLLLLIGRWLGALVWPLHRRVCPA